MLDRRMNLSFMSRICMSFSVYLSKKNVELDVSNDELDVLNDEREVTMMWRKMLPNVEIGSRSASA